MIIKASAIGMRVVAEAALGKMLMAYDELTQIRRTKSGKLRKKKIPIDVATYETLEDGQILTTLPAVEFLMSKNPMLKIDWERAPADNQMLDFRDLSDYISYRDYQYEALAACKMAKSGFVSSVVASGKTEILLSLAYAAQFQHNVMFIAPTSITLKNFKKRAEKYNMPFEVIDYKDLRKGKLSSKCGTVVICNPIMVVNDYNEGTLPPEIDTIGTLLTDEAHNFSGRETWLTLFRCMHSLVRSIGVSGTLKNIEPCNMAFTYRDLPIKSANLVTACGRVLFHKTAEDLKEYIDPPEVVNYHFRWICSDNLAVSNDWREISNAMNSYTKRLVEISKISRVLSAMRIPHIIPVSQKERGVRLRNLIGSSAVCWYGNKQIFTINEELDEEEVRERLGDDLFCIIGTSHLDEGANIPDVRATIFTEQKGGDSGVSIIQRAGRAARKGETKTFVVNFFDSQLILKYQAERRQNEILSYFSSNLFEVNSISEFVDTVNSITGSANG